MNNTGKINLFFFSFLFILFFSLAQASSVRAADYYFDSQAGADSNDGSSQASAWKTLAKMNQFNFQPGDKIYLKKGSSWSGGLVIDDSGQDSQPIIFTTYGDGNRPTFTHPNEWGDGVIIDAKYIVVEGIKIQNVHENGLEIRPNGKHNIVRNIEVENVGIGVLISGTHNLITQSSFHDLKMVRNTQTPDNDDFGAIGIVLSGSDNEVSYSQMINCKDLSYDYGLDGGAVEIYGDASRSKVHHNFAKDTVGFMEAGSGSGVVVSDVKVYSNIAINTINFIGIHLGSVFSLSIENFQVYNNTFFDISSANNVAAVSFFHQLPTNRENFIFRNNIIYSSRNVANTDIFTHDHNLYHLTNSAQPGFSLDSSEKVIDSKFISSAPVNKEDLMLSASSPAINAGTNVNLDKDFDGNSITDQQPDIGAYEYQAGSTVSPSPTSIQVVGDANQDQKVDGIDYVIWLQNFGKETNQGATKGDFNHDGNTDGIDYVLWLRNFTN